MRLLLTSGGVTNPSIHAALVQLLGKPVAECHALCVPTAQWGHPMCGPASVRGFVAAEPEFQHLSGLGWASLGVLELTALPTIGAERWVPWVREADVLLVDGGDATSRMPGGYDPNFAHFPSETTSAEPSTTLMAVCSSIA